MQPKARRQDARAPIYNCASPRERHALAKLPRTLLPLPSGALARFILARPAPSAQIYPLELMWVDLNQALC